MDVTKPTFGFGGMAVLAETFRQGAGEILRQASVALGGRPVTLWEVSEGPILTPQATSDPQPRHHFTSIDIDTTLKRWGVPIKRGTKWVGCRLSYDGPWVIAPVRSRPPAPPPGGHERRSAERLTIELAGLCLGLVDRRELAARPQSPTGGGHELLYDFLTLPAVIAHEAKNPLAAARAGLQLSMDSVQRLPVPENHRRDLSGELGEVVEALDRALDFLQAVQDRARGTKGGPTRFDAVRVARSVVALEGRVLRHRGVALELVTKLDAVHLNGDPGLLYELLLNLVRNAADATMGQSPIAVHIDREHDRLRISVRDRGVGIPPDLLEKVFEPGFSTKEDGEGLGAGLAIVRKVAQTEFDGAVSVTSTLGSGTTFTVSIPIPPQRGSQRTIVQPKA